MMSHSSTGSWSGGARDAADIIDLDRFMRTARPDARQRDRQLARNGLVVDGGGAARVASASSASARSRGKRASHDSGLSDTSYARRRHRPHRRPSASEPRAREPTARDSDSSLRAFRTACSRALRDQQQAIARVAQLCERLTARRHTPTTSDVSSSSRSTADARKDKHRTEECKTYKIIMTKLDELNRLFVARGRSPPGAAPPRPPGRDQRHPGRPPRGKDARGAHDTPSSVSVSDKLVATEPEFVAAPAPVTPVAPKRVSVETTWEADALTSASKLVERCVGGGPVGCGPAGCGPVGCGPVGCGPVGCGPISCGPVGHGCGPVGGPTWRGARSRRSSRLGSARPTLRRGECPSTCLESMMKGTSNEITSDSDAVFDMEDPVRLYAQAKRLQALHATTHGALRGRGGGGAVGGTGGGGGATAGAWGVACRQCLRALRQCLVAPLCCPTAWV